MTHTESSCSTSARIPGLKIFAKKIQLCSNTNMSRQILSSIILFLIFIGGFFVNIDVDTWLLLGNNITSIWIEHAHASTTTTDTSQDQSKWLNEAVQLVNAILWIISIIAVPAIILASWLLSPDWTSGDLFRLREPMYNMWIVVSNIVYFVYAILLILIALATIFGKENFSYKVMLPKLALGILMVPFTWWFVQWTISIATVVTASVITIPINTLADTAAGGAYLNRAVIPRAHYIYSTASWSENTQASCDGSRNDYCMSFREVTAAGWGTYSPLFLYAYDVFKLQEVKETRWTLNTITTIGQLLNQLVVGAIMFLIFGILVLALIAMLLLRAIKLWVYAIFSPLFTLHFVAGKELFGKESETFTLKEFIGLAFVPAVVWLTLSFGLIVVSAINGWGNGGDTQGQPCTNLTISNYNELWTRPPDWWCTIVTLFWDENNRIVKWIVETSAGRNNVVDVVRIFWINLVFVWKAVNQAAERESIMSSVNNNSSLLNAAWWIFGTIILNIIALLFIWLAFMAGKWVSKAVSVAVQPFEDLGKKVGNMAASAPKYMPLPIPGGSIHGAWRAVDQIQALKQTMAEKKYQDSSVWQFLARKNPEAEIDVKNLIKINEANSARDTKNLIWAAKEGLTEIRNIGKWEAIYRNGKTQQTLDKLIEALKDTKNDWAFMDEWWFDNSQLKRMKEIAKDERLDTEQRRKLVAAIFLGEQWNKIESSAWSVKAAEEYLKSWGPAKNNNPTNPSGGNTGTTAKINGDKIDIQVNTNTFTTGTIDLNKTNATDIATAISSTANIRWHLTKEWLETALRNVILDKTKRDAVIAELGKITGFFKTEPPTTPAPTAP